MDRWFPLKAISLCGAPIYVHWSLVAIVGLLALLGLGSPVYAILSIASYLTIIVIHEAGHAYVARHFGCRVRAIRMTFLHGWCEHEMPETEWEHVLIACGGVAAQLLIAVPILVIAFFLGDYEQPYFGPIIVFLGYINLIIALANLVPSQEFDGRLAWRVLPLLYRRWRARKSVRKVPKSASTRK